MEEPTDSLHQSGQLLHLLAYVYLENHRSEKAVVLLRAVDGLGLADARILALLALAYRRSGQPDMALETLDRIPSDAKGGLGAVINLIRAQALHALGRAPEAYTAMQTYIAMRSRQSDNHPGESL